MWWLFIVGIVKLTKEWCKDISKPGIKWNEQVKYSRSLWEIHQDDTMI